MSRLDDLMANGREELGLSADFEEGVFNRITRRKQQRRTAVITSVVSAVLGFAFALFLSLPRTATIPSMQARNPVSPTLEKEVIPVIEDVTFSTYGRNTHYAIEQVSLEEESEL